MTTKNQIITSRRDALKSIPLAASAVAIAASSVRAADVTPSQTAGPFYPDLNNDHTLGDLVEKLIDQPHQKPGFTE